jgi:hypothetical protein
MALTHIHQKMRWPLRKIEVCTRCGRAKMKAEKGKEGEVEKK